MHAINSSEMKYPAGRHRHGQHDGCSPNVCSSSFSFRSDLNQNETFEFYSNYLQLNRNTESRVEHALDLLNRSRVVRANVRRVRLDLRLSFRSIRWRSLRLFSRRFCPSSRPFRRTRKFFVLRSNCSAKSFTTICSTRRKSWRFWRNFCR